MPISAVMNHLDNHAKLKEDEVLCNDSIKLHSAEDGHLTILSIKHKAVTTPVSLSHEDKIHKGVSLGPKTPNLNQENIDLPCGTKTSPVFISSPLSSVIGFNSPTNGSPKTPKGVFPAEVDTSDNSSPKTPKGVFDPFAPGPDNLELAPICKKVLKMPWKFTPRQLKFDDFDECLENRNQILDCDIETMSEEMILESVYTSLLEAVVQKEIEVFLAKNPPPFTTITVKTPPDGRLTGIADECPAAPIKTLTSKSSNIDIIRRKLEF